MKYFNPKYSTVLLFIFIPILLYLFVIFVPLGRAFHYSLHSGTRFQLDYFIGLGNYIRLFSDPVFWISLGNNAIIVGSGIIVQLPLAFVLACILYFGRVRFSSYFRAVFFFPVIISPVVVSLLWLIMYHFQFGLLNNLLILMGLEDSRRNWLGEPNIAIFAITAPLVYQYLGLVLVILLSGMTGISKDVLEMAEIDGASGFRRAIFIILPLLKNTINVCLVLNISGGVRIFEQVLIMTRGGPGTSTMVMAYYSYLHSFTHGNIGYGSTIAIMMLIISLVVIFIMFMFRRGFKTDDI